MCGKLCAKPREKDDVHPKISWPRFRCACLYTRCHRTYTRTEMCTHATVKHILVQLLIDRKIYGWLRIHTFQLNVNFEWGEPLGGPILNVSNVFVSRTNGQSSKMDSWYIHVQLHVCQDSISFSCCSLFLLNRIPTFSYHQNQTKHSALLNQSSASNAARKLTR